MALIRRLFTAALVAGVLSGTAASVVQQATTVPLILEAEKYEVVTPPPAAASAAPAAQDHAAHGAPVRQIGEAVPESADEAFQRLWLTVASNLLTGVGYALLLAGVMLLMGERVDARRGLLWGAGGFVAFALSPSFGLPPELPGMAGADLEARQLWWLAAALCAGSGLLAVAFARNRALVAAGVVLAALPHLVGAPHPESPEGAFPPELAAHFVAVSLGGAALFWALLGAVCGAMMSPIVASTEDDDA
ncbi:CbtA family protein [Azospirillum agricola]|uniref:CbtA family protein n=1 Tax=Azospirillum agricola TaxID=1720247 RepID=UPI000A0F1EEF|nr:CbtA family protein [Azospirillum agricola]SMH34934.1 cobalt transporter subunit CbtA [Azospirillum lipoferum]